LWRGRSSRFSDKSNATTKTAKLSKVWVEEIMKPESILRVTTLLAAAGSLALSVYIYFRGTGEFHRLDGIYVGVWVSSILSLGAFLLAGRGKDK
jgi:hypothetical protein